MSKDAYWCERIDRLGPMEGFRIAEELRREVLRACPGWPDEDLRQADLLSHVRVTDLLRRAGSVRRR